MSDQRLSIREQLMASADKFGLKDSDTPVESGAPRGGDAVEGARVSAVRPQEAVKPHGDGVPTGRSLPHVVPTREIVPPPDHQADPGEALHY